MRDILYLLLIILVIVVILSAIGIL